jgi:hypothetical protein
MCQIRNLVKQVIGRGIRKVEDSPDYRELPWPVKPPAKSAKFSLSTHHTSGRRAETADIIVLSALCCALISFYSDVLVTMPHILTGSLLPQP